LADERIGCDAVRPLDVCYGWDTTRAATRLASRRRSPRWPPEAAGSRGGCGSCRGRGAGKPHV